MRRPPPLLGISMLDPDAAKKHTPTVETYGFFRPPDILRILDYLGPVERLSRPALVIVGGVFLPSLPEVGRASLSEGEAEVLRHCARLLIQRRAAACWSEKVYETRSGAALAREDQARLAKGHSEVRRMWL